MKRDFELIHQLLVQLEEDEAESQGLAVSEMDLGNRLMQEHAALVIEAGLAHGTVVRSLSGELDVVLDRLTWAGHDFLDATRDATLWAKAKRVMAERGGGVTFDLLLAWLKKEASEKLGLPG